MTPKELYSVKDLSELTSLSDYTIRKLINQGDIQSVRINSSIRVSREDFNTYIENLRSAR